MILPHGEWDHVAVSFAARHTGLAVAAIVVVSACARFAAALSFHAPWVAPDEMAYGLLGQSLWQTGELTIRGTAVGYYSLVYPALVGGPLSLGDTAAGIVAVQAVQAVVMSVVAVPVFIWGRRLAGDGLGLVAAGLSVLPPALAYSGLIMSEAVYYPAVAVALLTLARAVQEPTLFRLGVMLAAVTLAAAVRLQALVLLPTFATALVLNALFARDRRALRRYAAGGAALAALVLAAWLATGRTVTWGALLGAYETVGDDRPGGGDVTGALVRTAGAIPLVSLVFPFLATAVLAVHAARAEERDPTVRAFLATTVAYVAWLVLEVALFAASFVAYVPERYLVTAVPPLLLGLCVWLARGAARPWRALAPIVALTVALVAAISPALLFADVGAHDLLTSLTFRDLVSGADGAVVRGAVTGVVLLAAAAFALLPSRLAPVLAAAVAIGLAALSLGSSRAIAELSREEQAKAFGAADRTWIDDAATGERVALLNTGDREWPAVPRTAFWNTTVGTIVRFPAAHGSGAVPQRVVEPGPDGILRERDGSTLSEALVAAPTPAVLDGVKVAETAPTPVASGLALWRVAVPARLETLTVGLGGNGDFSAPVRVTVYSCGPGRLELTLLGKSGAPIAISANRIPRRVVSPPPDGLWQGSIAAPPDADGTSVCVFELSPAGLAGSTRIAFVRE